MTTKEFLQSISKMERELKSMKNRRDILMEMARGGLSPKMDITPNTCPVGSSMENYLCKALDLDAKIQAEQQDLDRKKFMVLEALSALAQPELESVIILRYFKNLSWKDVSESMQHSLSWVYKAHGEVLERLRLKVVA